MDQYLTDGNPEELETMDSEILSSNENLSAWFEEADDVDSWKSGILTGVKELETIENHYNWKVDQAVEIAK